MAAVPTVKIVHPDGFAIINKADFDPSKHTAFEGGADDQVLRMEGSTPASVKREIDEKLAAEKEAARKQEIADADAKYAAEQKEAADKATDDAKAAADRDAGKPPKKNGKKG